MCLDAPIQPLCQPTSTPTPLSLHAHTAYIPSDRPMHGLFDSWPTDQRRDDIIQLHDDVRSNRVLQGNGMLGSEHHAGTIVRVLEFNTLLGDFGEFEERDHLEAAAVLESPQVSMKMRGGDAVEWDITV